LQRTLERKPDFLKKVVHQDSKKDYILHIEFQVVNDKEMKYRMHEYYALLHRKYKINVLQVVFYIGDKKCTMTTKLDLLNLSFSYNLYSLKDISYKKFIDSDKPEEIILAILADFENEKSEKIIETIFNRIEATTKPNLEREKVVKQLEILSTLRKLQSQIVNQLQRMPFTYDIKNDIRYKQGREEGLEKGIEKSIESLLLKTDFTAKQVADILSVSSDLVKKIAKELKK
jgi:predicted transposase/invertase (TIGR01784 family)